ncbi:MAG: YaiI/YqxD family protein [Tissierellales bacterium]|jgi:uncharacterized protein YaiI (UPF0178 family)|nr:YaiI/YqxD family protein [Tissierellales bacterium]
MKIYIDADGCPVVRESVEIAKKYGLEIVLVSNISHEWKENYATIVQVGKGRDMADFEIVSRISQGDILITQDYGLAAMALGKTKYVLHQDGWRYTNDNMDKLLMMRHVSAKERRKGARTKGPKKRTKMQNEVFYSNLDEIIKKHLNEANN